MSLFMGIFDIPLIFFAFWGTAAPQRKRDTTGRQPHIKQLLAALTLTKAVYTPFSIHNAVITSKSHGHRRLRCNGQ